MQKDNTNNHDEKLPNSEESANELKQTSEEPGALANDEASAQQGGQQPGNSQGGQGGKTSDTNENSRHDTGDELSILGRLDS